MIQARADAGAGVARQEVAMMVARADVSFLVG
jgi:hypothetical protein